MPHRSQPGAPAGAQYATAAIHDGDAQVAGNPAVVVHARPVPVQAQERLLNDILGAGLITDQHQGQPDEPVACCRYRSPTASARDNSCEPAGIWGKLEVTPYKMPLAADC